MLIQHGYRSAGFCGLREYEGEKVYPVAEPSGQAAITLPPTIPLFPLGDVMLFPHITRPLYIFEPRYREMVADALEGDRLIGMVMLRPGYEADYEGRPPIYPLGCVGEITEYEMSEDGRYTIVVRGLVRFRVTDEDQGRAYRIGHVEAIPETLDNADGLALDELRERLADLFQSSVPRAGSPPSGVSAEDLVNGLSQLADIDPLDRQDLLEEDGPLARARALLVLLEGQNAPFREAQAPAF